VGAASLTVISTPKCCVLFHSTAEVADSAFSNFKKEDTRSFFF